MKKWSKDIKKIMVFLCMLFLCSGCASKGKESMDTKQRHEENETVLQEDVLWVAPMGSATYGREGMFFCKSNFIYFLDAATGESDIICDDINCTHEREKCSAYFDGITYVALNGDKLLIVTEDGADKTGDMYLCEADVNGTNRKELAHFGNLQSIWKIMITEEVIIISYYNSYDENMEPMDENIAGIYVYDRIKGKGEVLWEKQAYNAVASEFVYDKDEIYFYTFYYDITIDELLQYGAQSDFITERKKAELCRVNRNDKSFSVIQEDCEEKFDICQDKLWFSYKDAVWYYDVNTGEKGKGLDRAMRIIPSYGVNQVLMRDGKEYYTYYSFIPDNQLKKNGTKDMVGIKVIYPEITWALNYDTPTGNGEVIYWNTDEFISQGEIVSDTKEPILPTNIPSVTITEVPKEELTGETKETPVEQNEDIQVLTWVIPDMVSEEGLQGKIDTLNKKLLEDGYAFALQVKTVSWSAYRQQVVSMLDSGEVDIVSTGMDMTDGSLGYGQDFVRCGYLEELSGYLATEKGQRLKEWYSELEWKSVETDGKIYTLPNQYSIKGGSFLAFNKNYITDEMLQDFHGTPGELYELISAIDIPKGVYPIIGSYSVKNLAALCGKLLDYGVLFDLNTGKVENPFENKEFYNAMKDWNEIYTKGLVETFSYTGGDAKKEMALHNNAFVVWMGNGFDTLYEEKQEDVIYVNLPFVMQSALSSTNGINKKSENKDMAWELLTLLYTEETYANLLVFGEEGKDYQLADGFVTVSADKEILNYWERMTFGIYDAILPLKTDSLTVGRRNLKDSYYASSACLASAVLGFQPDFTVFSEGVPQAVKIMTGSNTFWKEKDFETAWANAKVEFEAYDGNRLVEKLNSQVEAWKKNTEN